MLMNLPIEGEMPKGQRGSDNSQLITHNSKLSS